MSSSDPDLTDLDTVFAPRIDDLVQSALENQSKEQRMMVDAVNAAKDALNDAKQDLSFLKERIQTRDTELMDVLEGRLSGLGREESITGLAERLEPVEHALNEVAERLEKIGDPLRTAVEDAIKTAFDRLDEMNSNFARALEGSARSVDAALRSMGEALDSLRDQTSQNASSMTELIEGSEGRTKELIERADETLSAKTNLLASELTSRSDALAAELTSRSDALADEMSSRSETLAAGITSRTEALAQEVTTKTDAISEELRRAGDELVGRIDESQSRSSESLQQASGELKEIASKSAIDLNDALQASAARTFDRIQKLREDLEGYTKQLSDLPFRTEEQLTEQAAAIEREMAEARQTIAQQLEAERKMMFERLDAHLNATKASGAAMSRQIESTKSAVDKKLPEIERKVADRIEVIGEGLAEQMEAIRTTIDSEVPEMEKRMGGYLAKVRSVVDAQPPVLADKVDEVLGPVLSEMEKIGERFQNVNRRVTESNSRMETMQEALIRYLTERDARLEEVRDAVLGDVIRQFSETLKPKDRTKISDALREAEQRRKDRRDADRYRKLKSKSPQSIPAPEPPRELLEMPLGRPDPPRTSEGGRDSQILEDAPLWEPATSNPTEDSEPEAEIEATAAEHEKPRAKPKTTSGKKAKTTGPAAKAKPRAAATKPKPKAKSKSKPKVVAFETPPDSSKTVKIELPKEAGGPDGEKDQDDPTGSIPKSS